MAKNAQLEVLGGRDQDVLEAVLGWFREEAERWFLVLDDFDKANLSSDCRSMIQQLIQLSSTPTGARGALLITTREPEHNWSAEVPTETVVELSVPEAVRLLHSCVRAGPIDPHFEAPAISLVTRLDCHPLAIVLAAGYMKSRSLSADDFLKSFPDAVDRPFKHETFLGETWTRLLDQFSSDASDFLSLLAMFNVAEIPRCLLQIDDQENSDLRPEVRNLIDNGLLSPTPEQQSFLMHNIVGSAVRKRLESKGQAALFAHQALELMVNKFPLVREENLETCEILCPAALSILGQDLLESSWENQGFLLFKVGVFQYYKGKLDHAFEMVSKACEVLRENGYSDDQPGATLLRETLASILLARGQYLEATEIYQTTLEQKQMTLGDDHPEVLRISVQLARLYFKQQELSKSEHILRTALNKLTVVLGSTHPQTLSAMNLLATTLYREAKYEEAEDLFRETWKGYVMVMGVDHPDSLASMNSYVSTLIAQGKFDESLPPARNAVESSHGVLGEGHPDTLAAVNNLALILCETGQLDEAEELNRRALDLYEQKLGKYHPSRLTSLHNLARIYMLQGKLLESEAVYREELTGLEKTLGPDHAATEECRALLAEVLIEQEQQLHTRDPRKEPYSSASAEGEQSVENLGAALSAKLELKEVPVTLTQVTPILSSFILTLISPRSQAER